MSSVVDEGPLLRRQRAGPSLYYMCAMPEGPLRAMVGIVPGYADNSGRYAHVMGALADQGIGCIALDLRGHGRAAGARGACQHFGEYVDDVRELGSLLTARATMRGEQIPLFLLGHSFGGLVASSLLTEDSEERTRWRGLLLCSPFFGLALPVAWPKRALGLLASRVYPTLALPTGIHGKDVTHDAHRAREYETDPLVFKKARARWFSEVLHAQKRALPDAPKLETPLYVVFGTRDPVASLPVARRFFDLAGSYDKTWDPREGLLHEVWNEPSWKEVVDTMAHWIVSRTVT